MPLTSYSIPNLIQGISQQSDSQRDPTQGELQVNGYSSLADGLRKRAGGTAIRRLSTTSLGDVFFHSILRDSGEKYLVVIGKTAVRVFDLDGVEKTVSAPFGYGYLSTVTSCATDVRAASIADYCFISSVKRVPAMSTALAPAIARPAANEALVWVKAANYGQTYRVSINGTLATVTTPVQPVVTSGSTVTENRIGTADIAESIKAALAEVSGVSITREGSVLHVTSSSAITISATDARANADITAITRTVQAFTDLPTIAPKGYQVEVVGDPTNQYDGYFVSFVPKGSTATFGEGTWQECVASGMPYQLDAATMPQLLVRLSNGTFYFGPANGSTQSGTKIPAWGQRTAGDYDTAPDPSFIGYPIQDVFVHRNRLGLLADENVILSRAKAFFDFFPETVTTVLDTDPIDLAASSNRVSVLRHAVSNQDELLLFSDQLQFRLASGDATLTPATAMVSVLTAYEADTGVKPLQVAGGIVFAQTNGSWTQFREFSVRGVGTALVGTAASITDHVSTFIPAGVMQLAGNDTAGVWFAIARAAISRDRIFVYKYADRASGATVERIQRSWSYWQLTSGSQVLQILCVQESLYFLVEYLDGSVWLERMPVADRLSTDALTTLLLDRQVTTTTATPAHLRVASGTYNTTTKTTTWTLPYTAQGEVQAWSMYGDSQNGGKLLGRASSGNTITARGNWALKDVMFGEPFEFRYRFSRFKLMQEQSGGRVASNVDRTQVRHARLRYHDTSYFKALVTAERRDTATYTFDGWQLGVRNSQPGSSTGSSQTASIEPLFTVNPNPANLVSFLGIYVLGYGFFTQYDRKVTAVGTYASSNVDHKVGIWSFGNQDQATGIPEATLLWQGLLPAGSGTASGDFRWHVVDGPLLQGGAEYIVGATWGEEPVPAILESAQVALLWPGTSMGNVGVYGAVNTEQGAVPQLDVDLSNPAYTPTLQSPDFSLGFFSANLSFGEATVGGVYDIQDRQYFDGVFSIPIQARGESCIVELVNDTPNPCMFSSCDWIAQITSKAQRLP